MWHELYVEHNCPPELLVFTSVAVGFFGEVELFQSSSEFADSFFLVELIVTPRISRPFTLQQKAAVDRQIRIVVTVSVRQSQSFPSRIYRPFTLQQKAAGDRQIRKSPDKFQSPTVGYYRSN